MSDDELDSTEDGSQRPNAKYNLSKQNGGSSEVYGFNSSKETLNFHYNRERRLANAPQSVVDLYNPPKKIHFGLLGVLVADKPRRMLFVSIILLCAAIFTLNGLGFFDRKFVLDGNRINVSGTSFEEVTIIIIKKTAQNTRAYTGAVNIAVFVSQINDEPYNYFPHRIEFTMDKEQVYRFAAPFDDEVLQIVLQTETDHRLHLSFKPE